ncbi:hypothetical protein QFC21_001336 [Naganishia friedmannii]|uniref:Uncharacterized protein n=1 Tax=Naganishia friedmannii TaxID=89922 RepID=A0ACC2W3J8_9TREE|nr:hypothetical protein QFC21_001336 [Naganishia friedmannii]
MIGKLALTSLLPALALAQYTATYDPNNLPKTTEDGQAGTNQCGTGSSQDSMCQNVYLNSLDDFCLFAPSSTTSAYGDSSLGNTEREVVSWCLKSGYGTRLIPAGAVTGAHFVKTPTYIQLSGTLAVLGGPSALNIPASEHSSGQVHLEFPLKDSLRTDDDGGELDPHGADGLGNPIGGLVFSSAFGGGVKQIHEWNSFIGSGYFCFKACNQVEGADLQCQHIYDVLGCGFNVSPSLDAIGRSANAKFNPETLQMPGDYSESFSSCQGDAAEYPGIYGSSTFQQGLPSTPAPHAPAATSQCSYMDSLPYNGAAAIVTAAVSPSGSASSPASSGMSSTSAASSGSSSAASTSGSSSMASSSMASSSMVSSSMMASSASSRSSSSSGSSVAAASSSRATSMVSSTRAATIVPSITPSPTPTTGTASAQSAAASPSNAASGAIQNSVAGLGLALAGVLGAAFNML